MLVLFPSDPFEPKKPDPDWATEADIAKQCGYQVAFVHWESLVNDDDAAAAVKYVPDFEEPTPAIYRGWMLTSDQYEKLYEKLQVCLVDLINTPHQYRKAHEFPGWYLDLVDSTPDSAIIQKHEISVERILRTAQEMLGRYEHGILIKDYVKSRKHEWEEACFIPNMEKAQTVISNFLERQGDDLQGGVILRQFVPLKSIGKHPQSGMPMSEEFRIFWLNGHSINISEYWDEDAYERVTHEVPEPDGGWEESMPRSFSAPKSIEDLPSFETLGALAAKVDSQFFSMDLAQTADGEWIIMEIGDGQVSGFPQMPNDAMKFYPALGPILSHKHGSHDHEGDDEEVVEAENGRRKNLPPLTQVTLDGMTCAVEGCDHKSHSTEMFLHPQCHIGAPTWCSYENGALTVSCSECKRIVAKIAVDPGNVPRH
jgi:hypothetical protein